MKTLGGRLLLVQFSSNRDGSTFSGLQLLDGFKKAGWETHVFFGHAGPMIEQYQDHGHITSICQHKNWLRQPMPWQFLRNRWQAKRDGRAMVERMRAIAPTIVYVNSGASYAGAWAARLLGLPAVWHVRELMSAEGGELHAPWGFRHTIKRCFRKMTQARIANSYYVARVMFGRDPNAHVIHNGVDDSYLEMPIDRREARQRCGISLEHVAIGIPGTLRPVKGHAFAMRSLAPWLRGSEKRCMLISGNRQSAHAHSMQQIAADLGISNRVLFLGTIRDMRLFYDACDLALVPSASESFGRVATEAMARQIPLICTRTGGLPEVVQDGWNGLMVDYEDEWALLHAVERLSADEVLRQRLVSQALADVREKFSSARYQEQLFQVVDILLQNASQRSRL